MASVYALARRGGLRPSQSVNAGEAAIQAAVGNPRIVIYARGHRHNCPRSLSFSTCLEPNSSSAMAELRIAGIVANLEGYYRLKLPQDAVDFVSEVSLESRVRALEARQRVNSPPPIMESSLESIAWRVWRLKSKLNAKTANPPSRFAELVPDTSDISLETLRVTAAALGLPGAFSTPWPKTDTDEVLLSVIIQKLCHVCGFRWQMLETIPVERADIYAAIVEASLEAETTITPFRAPPGWPRGVLNAKKGCCGCCSCNCHSRANATIRYVNSTRRSTASSSASSISVTPRRKTRFDWLKKVFCWRRPELTVVDDDASSVTSCSRTIIEV